MSIGRIELIDGQKQFKQYDSGGGGGVKITLIKSICK